MRKEPVVMGIDPGSANTGIVVRKGNRLLEHYLAQRRPDESMADYMDLIYDTLICIGGADIYAVEYYVPPNPHVGMTSVLPAIETAELIGYLRAIVPIHQAWVRPSGYSKMATDARAIKAGMFPSQLVGPKETAGKGKLKDCRAAWLIAEAPEALNVINWWRKNAD